MVVIERFYFNTIRLCLLIKLSYESEYKISVDHKFTYVILFVIHFFLIPFSINLQYFHVELDPIVIITTRTHTHT